MKLPIPIVTELGNTFDEVEIVKPKASVIADTKKMVDTGDIFTSVKTFLGGCIESISGPDKTISEKPDIKNMLNIMPYRSAEVCFYNIFVLYDPENDAVEGVYRCPRCANNIVSEYYKSGDIEIDTRDYISSLNVNYMNGDDETISVDLNDPVVIMDKGRDEVIEEIKEIEMRYPTLSDCIKAEKKYGLTDSIRMQLAIYVESLMKINGHEVDNKFKKIHGMFIFENIKDVKGDLKSIGDKVSQFGLDPRIEKLCKKCGKEFHAPLNMSNFFVSGLAL